ncbi:hypothetical protein D3C85_839800 [compost metagenome]
MVCSFPAVPFSQRISASTTILGSPVSKSSVTASSQAEKSITKSKLTKVSALFLKLHFLKICISIKI